MRDLACALICFPEASLTVDPIILQNVVGVSPVRILRFTKEDCRVISKGESGKS